MDTWDDLRAEGIDLTHVGTDLVGNSIIVSIDGLRDSDIKTIKGRFGTNIKFRDRPAAVADACPESNCRPIKGGIRIDGVRPCTSGFIVRRQLHGAPLSVLTAGHCLWINGGLQSKWRHGGTSDPEFGDSKWNTFLENSNADVGIIEIDTDEQPSIANKMYINNGSTGALYNVTYWIPDSYQTQGSQACAYGSISNNSECVTITDPDEANISCVPLTGPDECRMIQHRKSTAGT